MTEVNSRKRRRTNDSSAITTSIQNCPHGTCQKKINVVFDTIDQTTKLQIPSTNEFEMNFKCNCDIIDQESIKIYENKKNKNPYYKCRKCNKTKTIYEKVPETFITRKYQHEQFEYTKIMNDDKYNFEKFNGSLFDNNKGYGLNHFFPPEDVLTLIANMIGTGFLFDFGTDRFCPSCANVDHELKKAKSINTKRFIDQYEEEYIIENIVLDDEYHKSI